MFEQLESYILTDDVKTDDVPPLSSKRLHYIILGIISFAILLYVRIEFQNDHGHSLSTIYTKSLEHLPVKCKNQDGSNNSEDTKQLPSYQYNSIQETFNPQYREDWRILGFTNMKYVDVAKIWYMQLYKLGYRNHRLAALDYTTYNYLNNFTDFQGGIIYAYGAKERKSLLGGKSIWQVRIDTVLEQLESGMNIFVIDVDSIWLKYRDFSLLSTNVDIFHADGNPMPHDIASYNRYKNHVKRSIHAKKTPFELIKMKAAAVTLTQNLLNSAKFRERNFTKICS